MDRGTFLALLVAGGSLTASALREAGPAPTLRHGFAMVLPLAAIAFPEMIEFGYRRSWHGIAHGGEAPAPAAAVRGVAWFLLVVMVLLYHSLAWA
jgi:hypothetical protein